MDMMFSFREKSPSDDDFYVDDNSTLTMIGKDDDNLDEQFKVHFGSC